MMPDDRTPRRSRSIRSGDRRFLQQSVSLSPNSSLRSVNIPADDEQQDDDDAGAYANLSEVGAPAVDQNPDQLSVYRHQSLEDRGDIAGRRRSSKGKARSDGPSPAYSIPERGSRRTSRAYRCDAEESTVARDEFSLAEDVENLNEVTSPPPIQNPDGGELYELRSIEDDWDQIQAERRARRASRRMSKEPRHSGILEEARSPAFSRISATPTTPSQAPGVLTTEPDDVAAAPPNIPRERTRPASGPPRPSPLVSQIYTVCYLIFFSIWGAMARLGLEWITYYPGAPVLTPVLWANFAGSAVMGYLQEDRSFFRLHHRAARDPWAQATMDDSEKRASISSERDPRKHLAHKKTIPLYIGLATGFCGTLTSFSAFIVDTFLALSNDLALPPPGRTTPPFPHADPAPRHNAYSLPATLAVPILTLSCSLAALSLGAHLSLLLTPHLPPVPSAAISALDRTIFLLGPGLWLAAILLSALPPSDTWRALALTATLAPAGCLLRYVLALRLNGVAARFPVGTFAANVFGTAVGSAGTVLRRVALVGGQVGGGATGAAALAGVVDGFAGGCSTVSTWVVELRGLRRGHAYVYGGVSVVVALGVAVAVMGGVKWSVGWDGG